MSFLIDLYMFLFNTVEEEHLNVILQCFARQTAKRLNLHWPWLKVKSALALISGEYVYDNTHVKERVTWLTNVSATVMCCRRLDIISWDEVLYHFGNLFRYIYFSSRRVRIHWHFARRSPLNDDTYIYRFCRGCQTWRHKATIIMAM